METKPECTDTPSHAGTAAARRRLQPLKSQPRRRLGPPTRPRSAKACSSRARSPDPSRLYIDGKVEGAINLPGNRVTVGRNGQVAANIVAREVVVLGKVRGNVSATDRVDIRAEGALNGDVSAARISIEDGAFFKGGIDIRKADAKPAPAGGAPNAIQATAPAAHEPHS